jgi:chromatin remodeling complex protein RSC6
MVTATQAPIEPSTTSTEVSTKRRPNAAFMKPLTPSKELAAIVGGDPLPRTAVISGLWVYIKQHQLQDASDKRMINADSQLQQVFGKPRVSMFEMAGLIGKHLS